ncbi:DUF4129 domain-containing protein [Pseudomonadota bacterium]
MKLEDVTIRIRPRNKWEGADLGLLMVNAWWRPMLGAWIIITLPVFVVLLLVISDPGIAMLVFWWLKPVFERSHLYVLSHALFGNTPTVKQILRSFWSVAKIQWLMSLSLRRFSLTRSADLPIIQLEGLRGKERKKRIQLLHHHNMNPASWLTVLGVHVETVLLVGILGLIVAFIPEQTEFDYMVYISDAESSYRLLTAIVGYLVMTMVAPFYVATGFSAYINTRTHLEGWDIELAFRRIAKRISNTKVKSLGTAASIFFSLIFIGFFSSLDTVNADEQYRLPPKRLHTPVTVKKDIEEILSSNDFHNLEKVRKLKSKDGSEFNLFEWLKSIFKGENRKSDTSSISWVQSIGRMLAHLFEVLLWVIPIIIIIYLVLYFKDKNLYFRFYKKEDDYNPPISLFGLDMRDESLPDNVLGEVDRLWRLKKHRQSLSLLYRASLVRMMRTHQVEFAQGDTEGECLQKVRSAVAQDLATYFKKMTGAWITLAYGHQSPSSEMFDDLCRSWKQLNEDSTLKTHA